MCPGGAGDGTLAFNSIVSTWLWGWCNSDDLLLLQAAKSTLVWWFFTWSGWFVLWLDCWWVIFIRSTVESKFWDECWYFTNGGFEFSIGGWFSILWFVGGSVSGSIGSDGSVANGSCGSGEAVRLWFLKLLGMVVVMKTRYNQVYLHCDCPWSNLCLVTYSHIEDKVGRN